MVDFSVLNEDELADAGAAFITEVETRIAALPVGAMKRSANRHADRAHWHLQQIKLLASDESMISPMSGGDKT